MALRCVCLILTLCTCSSAADTWDDFANNLATDLAPILQLFGEQVTKQFLSESTSRLDNIIFAMAPLGIITAVVSVIRVCGSPLLRAFIGKAQEGAGVAEAELCSSTGRDVCEMYQNGAITRVFGRPQILEIVHDRCGENFYTPEDGEEYAPAGIYTFSEYQRTRQGKAEWVDRGEKAAPGPLDDGEASAGLEPRVGEFALNPNLMLNIGFRRPSRRTLLSLAVFSVLLQASVIAYAIIAERHLKLMKEDQPPPAWGLPLTIIGTVVLCTGMFICAYLIEQSTMERTFDRKKLPVDEQQPQSTIHWIQPGGQVVGDHSFDSFAYSDLERPLKEYISSWRRSAPLQESRWTWVAVSVTMIGFIVQFVGLRAVHSTVSVFQLGAVLLMSILRALLRTKRLDIGANRITRRPLVAQITGHELDWLAFDLYEQNQHASLVGEDPMPKHYLSSWQISQVASRKDTGRNLISAPAGDEDLVLFGDVATSVVFASSGTVEKDSKWLARVEGSSLHGTRPDPATTVWHYRARLNRLTTRIQPQLFQQPWPDEMVQGRLVSTALDRVISMVASTILPRANRDCTTTQVDTLYFGYHCAVTLAPSNHQPSVRFGFKNDKSDKQSSTKYSSPSLRACSYFSLRRETNAGEEEEIWSADCSQLEAAITLQVWSMLNQPVSRISRQSKNPTIKEARMRRIIYGAPHGSSLETIVSRIQAWSDTHRLNFREHVLMSNDTSLHRGVYPVFPGPASTWQEVRNRGVYTEKDWASCSPTETPYRFFGWNTIPFDTWAHPRTAITVLSSNTNGSLAHMTAQDLFTGFLRALLSTCDRPLGDSTFVKSTRGYHIENQTVKDLIDIFVQNNLGSKADAVMCIIPTIIASGCKSPVQDTIDALLNSSSEHLSQDKVEQAGNDLKWALTILDQGADDLRIRSCYLKLARIYRRMSKSQRTQAQDSWLQDGLTHLLATSVKVEDSTGFVRELAVRLRYMHFIALETSSYTYKSDLVTSFVKDTLEPLGIRGDYDWDKWNADTLLKAVSNQDDIGAAICLEDYQEDSKRQSGRGGRTIVSLLASCRGKLWRSLTTEILEKFQYPILRDMDGRDALSWACVEGDVEVVNQMIKAGGDLERPDKKKRTPIHRAIEKNRLDVLRGIQRDRILKWLENRFDAQFWVSVHSSCVQDEAVSWLLDYRLYPDLGCCPEAFRAEMEERVERLARGPRVVAKAKKIYTSSTKETN